jgi:hypothetical protein
MQKSLVVKSLWIVGLLLAAVSAEARVNLDIGIGVPLFYPAPFYHHSYYGPYYPRYYAPEYYYPPVAPVIVQPAPVVVQAPVPSQVVYQYYCAPASSYYPAVPTCTEPWIKVAPDGTRSY